MRNFLLTALAACSIFASVVIAAPAGARPAQPETSPQVAAEEQQEAAAEAAEAAEEQAELAEAHAEDLASAELSPAHARQAEQYPVMYSRIPKIEARLAKLLALKAALRELPLHSKRRKVFLPQRHARIEEERRRLADVHKKIHAKKEAARLH
ncbi:MAG TPA: hypothetical protein VHT25_12715 [Solirubrobacteraceae bacterium]|jgi:hypothetical protein|nr:hypothetical protein [Solirubrobacteraceae bacterium]